MGDKRRRPDKLGVIIESFAIGFRAWEVWPGASQEPAARYVFDKLRSKYRVPVYVITEEIGKASWDVEAGHLPAEIVKGVEDQWLPLDRVLRDALEALPRRGKRVFSFVARDGHAINPQALSMRIVKLARKAGVKLTMRALRRGFGCFHASRVPAQVLQKLMRHSNITTTMAFYANVDAAVEEAILSRNSSRNSEVQDAAKTHANMGPSPIREVPR
jgi:hypothetical protein